MRRQEVWDDENVEVVNHGSGTWGRWTIGALGYHLDLFADLVNVVFGDLVLQCTRQKHVDILFDPLVSWQNIIAQVGSFILVNVTVTVADRDQLVQVNSVLFAKSVSRLVWMIPA